MKKKILMAISVLLVLGLAIAAFAYNNTSNHSHREMMANCCKDGSCPMKDKNASLADKQTSSCCDNPDCSLKGGDSCPMKKQSETTSPTVGAEMKNVSVVTSDEDCCQKDGDCCKNGGDCCKKHQKS